MIILFISLISGLIPIITLIVFSVTALKAELEDRKIQN